MQINGCSFSSDKKLSRCEQQFDYRYGQHLKLKRKKIALYRGDWIHQCLQARYLKTGWLIKFGELVKTSWTPLFDEEKEMYGLDFPGSIKELLELYDEYWSEWEVSWEILHVEKRFELATKHGFPVKWQADLIVSELIKSSSISENKSHNRRVNILVETKTKKTIPDSSERILQPQTHGYAFLLSKVGIKIDSILWNYIRTEEVPRPQILKSGALSERKINTDKNGYMKSLKEAGITVETAADWQGIQNHLNTLPDTLVLERIPNSVNLKLGELAVRDWVERARRAQTIERPLRSWNRNCKWDCDYFNLCQVDMVGKADRNLVILKDFTTKSSEPEPLNH